MFSNYVEKYIERHGEIYNAIEQQRLYDALKNATKYIHIKSTDRNTRRALDLGCGAGNLTTHLLNLNFRVIAADVSDKFLKFIKNKYRKTKNVETLKLNGQDLSNIEDNYFDLTAIYSVLHHISDYLKMLEEMVRVTKSGGVIFIDHEVNDNYWKREPIYEDFLKELKIEPVSSLIDKYKRYFMLSKYVDKVKQLLGINEHKVFHYQEEGDIHVWENDHIEWNKIEETLLKNKCSIMINTKYLVYRSEYKRDVYARYRDQCSDMQMIVVRKENGN